MLFLKTIFDLSLFDSPLSSVGPRLTFGSMHSENFPVKLRKFGIAQSFNMDKVNCTYNSFS